MIFLEKAKKMITLTKKLCKKAKLYITDSLDNIDQADVSIDRITLNIAKVLLELWDRQFVSCNIRNVRRLEIVNQILNDNLVGKQGLIKLDNTDIALVFEFKDSRIFNIYFVTKVRR